MFNHAVLMNRKVLKDFTFSDGLTIPEGSYISVASSSMHRDEQHYSDPAKFDGLRFFQIAKKNDKFNRHSMVSLGTDYIVFGHGHNAWYATLTPAPTIH
jgi:cytochrome P450